MPSIDLEAGHICQPGVAIKRSAWEASQKGCPVVVASVLEKDVIVKAWEGGCPDPVSRHAMKHLILDLSLIPRDNRLISGCIPWQPFANNHHFQVMEGLSEGQIQDC